MPDKFWDEDPELRAVAEAEEERYRQAIPDEQGTEGVSLDDFYAYMPQHNYIFAPNRSLWPGESVNSRIPPVPLTDRKGEPVLDKEGKQIKQKASAWLDRKRPVEQMIWAPGRPTIVKDKLMIEGGWKDRRGVSCFNLYHPPTIRPGDPQKAGKWTEHIRFIYPDDADHILDWLAHRVQRPGEKINHALILGGNPGIGKDTMLEPVIHAVGPWNCQEASPSQILDKHNGFLKSVLLRVSEAHDLGEFDRFQFYDRMKAYTAAPPDVLRVNEKYIREHMILNCCGVIVTTNHKTDGIYLPADDRRNYVAWSDITKEDKRFQGGYWNDMHKWYERDGNRHVTAYLQQRDISGFDAKAPPPRTETFWAIVNSNRPSEEAELADIIDTLHNPDTLTLEALTTGANNGNHFGLADWLKDRKNRRTIPHRLEKCGYVPVRNPDATSARLWPSHWVLCRIAERVGNGFVERRPEFLRLRCGMGREETLFPPELAPDGGKRVGESGA